MSSSFILSLDTELHWGYNFYPNSREFKLLKKEESRTISAINDVLHLLDDYDIPATWAIVGKIFLDHPELIDKIISSPIKHDIGYHSFSHIKFSSCDHEIAEREIIMGLEIANNYNISFKSFVYPENDINHLDILKKYGFLIYRGPNFAGRSLNKPLHVRSLNFAISKFFSPPVKPLWRDGIWEIPSSMIFNDPFLKSTLPLRAKTGIANCINRNEIFHIFMHPEDVLLKPKLIDQLEEVLKFIDEKRMENKIEVITMKDLAISLMENRD